MNLNIRETEGIQEQMACCAIKNDSEGNKATVLIEVISGSFVKETHLVQYSLLEFPTVEDFCEDLKNKIDKDILKNKRGYIVDSIVLNPQSTLEELFRKKDVAPGVPPTYEEFNKIRVSLFYEQEEDYSVL